MTICDQLPLPCSACASSSARSPVTSAGHRMPQRSRRSSDLQPSDIAIPSAGSKIVLSSARRRRRQSPMRRHHGSRTDHALRPHQLYLPTWPPSDMQLADDPDHIKVSRPPPQRPAAAVTQPH